MPRINYIKKAERELVVNDLIRFAESLRQRWPNVASIIYGAVITVQREQTIAAARVMAAFCKSILNERAASQNSPELSMMKLLIDRGSRNDETTIADTDEIE